MCFITNTGYELKIFLRPGNKIDVFAITFPSHDDSVLLQDNKRQVTPTCCAMKSAKDRCFQCSQLKSILRAKTLTQAHQLCIIGRLHPDKPSHATGAGQAVRHKSIKMGFQSVSMIIVSFFGNFI